MPEQGIEFSFFTLLTQRAPASKTMEEITEAPWCLAGGFYLCNAKK